MTKNVPQTIAVYVFRIGSFGDSIVSIPAIKRIKDVNKGARFFLITNFCESGNVVDAWNDIFQYLNIFQGVLQYGKNITSLLRLASEIKKISATEKILYYLAPGRSDLQRLRDWLFFRYVCGVKNLHGFSGVINSVAKRDSMGRLLGMQKESLRLLKIVDEREDNDAIDAGVFPLFFPTQEVIEKVDGILPEKGTKIITVGFSSKKKSGTWPWKNFSILCKKLTEYDSSIRIVLVGGAGDFENGELIKSTDPKIYNLCGKTSIIETATVIKRSSLFIGNDSGPMHLAAAMNTQVVAIFSARDNPGKWEPVGKNYIVIRREVSCEGCLLDDCRVEKLRCLTSITVEEVYNECIKKLDVSKSKGN